jgi:hypothetical protein
VLSFLSFLLLNATKYLNPTAQHSAPPLFLASYLCIMDATPSPGTITGFLLKTKARRSTPSSPSSPSIVLERRLAFNTCLEDTAVEDDSVGIRCDCKLKCHAQVPDSFLKRRRAEFEKLDSKARQYRSYLELQALAGTPATDTLLREVNTRHATFASIITSTVVER